VAEEVIVDNGILTSASALRRFFFLKHTTQNIPPTKTVTATTIITITGEGLELVFSSAVNVALNPSKFEYHESDLNRTYMYRPVEKISAGSDEPQNLPSLLLYLELPS